jgi:hypothetical protein
MDCSTEAGPDLKAYDVCGTTALSIAVTSDETVLAFHLMEKGSDINILDFGKGTFSCYAVYNNNPQCIEHWVQLGPNINYQGSINRSITAVSTDKICVCVCDIVVENHDRTNLSDGLESTALHLAV